jgi:hypothetical protein
MSRFAKGSKAYGFCDRTGFRYPLKDLVRQFENLRPNGLLVGKDVVDIDHEQLQLGRVNSNDPQTLEDPRPDRELVESRSLSAWNPVGGGITEFGSRTVGLDVLIRTGRVSVS